MRRRFAFVFDDFGSAGFLVSCSVDCYSLEVVERLVEFQGVSAVFAEPGEIWLPRPCVVPEKSNTIIGVVTVGFERLPLSCDGLTGSEEKSNTIIGVVTVGFERLPLSCDGLTGSEDHGPMNSSVDTLCGYRG
ncbi:hypothetical protein F511_34041 [Dorcoceras hygrometricum]|uniref:Uncharacterized protein n=1 Tax=Dorcoceras hygrometricum TaxID=472368 RepID=A0A2Z7BLY3_9LAMI|nr:hypothetical protein F511_34041 [Dorcoceras hygrometricum]